MFFMLFSFQDPTLTIKFRITPSFLYDYNLFSTIIPSLKVEARSNKKPIIITTIRQLSHIQDTKAASVYKSTWYDWHAVCI